MTIHQALREARVSRGISQQELAASLGLGQRQISDLERAAVDTRLSTLQHVAGALDLQVMLVPRQLVAIVEGLARGGAEDAHRPMYTLDDDDGDRSA